MKNIIIIVLTLTIFALMALTASRGHAYHGGELGKVIEDIAKSAPVKNIEPQRADTSKEDKEKLSSLQDQAGSVGEVKVSQSYKSKCSACHGADGSGEQNGRKLMGTKLYGQSSDKLYKDLIDFKDGRRENVIMKGLLINISEAELKEFANEIGAFSTQKNSSK